MYISSFENICEPSLFQFMNNEDFKISSIYKKDDEKILKIDYTKPFNFIINIKWYKDQLNKFNNLEFCKEIHLSMKLTNEDINFIKSNNLHNLEALYLGNNNITDIGFYLLLYLKKIML